MILLKDLYSINVVIQITIDNSYSKITGLNIKQFNSLKKELSYRPPYNHFSPMANRMIPLIDKHGNFPTGLLPIVKAWKKSLPEKVQFIDKRVKPAFNGTLRFRMPAFEHVPDREQLNAATAAVKHHRGIISAVTGYGKSVIAGLIVHSLQVRTVIAVPSIELKTQLTESMITWFGKDKVGKGKDIYIENIQSLEDVDGYDAIIIDEFHHSGAKSYRSKNKKKWNKIYYRFGLTATPFRSDENEKLLLESVLSQVIYRIPYKTGVKNKRVVPVEAYYVELPKVPVEGYTWKEVYNELIVHNAYRNDILRKILFMLGIQEKSILCLVKEIAHGNNIVSEYFANGVDPDSTYYLKLFNSEKLRGLVATQGYCGEGIDTKPAEYVVIAGLGKSKNQFMQAVGRGLRVHKDKESCKVIIFKDSSHKFTLQHFKAQCKILKDEYGVTPIKIDI